MPGYDLIMVGAIMFWGLGLAVNALFREKQIGAVLGEAIYLSGTMLLIAKIGLVWAQMGRPPLRTLGETRLWYAIFLSGIGYLLFLKLRHLWLLKLSGLISAAFLAINLFRPENFDRDLPPALQSPWFIPHVSVYILSYALLGAAVIMGGRILYEHYRAKAFSITPDKIDNIVYAGYGLLTMGMLSGALWGKEAWGHYWTWDPKEVWAFVTWLAYLFYIHYRLDRPERIVTSMWILTGAFFALMICWFGVNYLPSSEGSMHVY